MEGLISKEQVLETLKIGTTTLWKLGKRGYLAPRKIGRKHYYLKEDFDNFLANPPIPPAYAMAKRTKKV